jgi:TRAP-type C4-dicarboxylate transport system permease small subunit
MIGIGLAIAVAINAANIVGRYVFRSPIAWAEEFLVFLLIWCVMIGASAVTYDRAQLTMDLFVGSFSRPVQIAIKWLTTALAVMVCIYAASQASVVVQLMYRMGQVSMSAQIPMIIPYSAFVCGFVMIALASVASAIRRDELVKPQSELSQ